MLYQVYHVSFERLGQERLRGLAFFFGLLFIVEVALTLLFGSIIATSPRPISTSGACSVPSSCRRHRGSEFALEPPFESG